jgi:hypothetical protein
MSLWCVCLFRLFVSQAFCLEDSMQESIGGDIPCLAHHTCTQPGIQRGWSDYYGADLSANTTTAHADQRAMQRSRGLQTALGSSSHWKSLTRPLPSSSPLFLPLLCWLLVPGTANVSLRRAALQLDERTAWPVSAFSLPALCALLSEFFFLLCAQGST